MDTGCVYSDFAQLGVQFLGGLSIVIWTCLCSGVFFKMLDYFDLLRLRSGDESDEELLGNIGLDFSFEMDEYGNQVNVDSSEKRAEKRR